MRSDEKDGNVGWCGNERLLAALERLRVLQRSTDPSEFQGFLDVCLEAWPSEASLRRIAAASCAKSGDMTAALAHDGVALALDPDDWSVHRHMARIMEQLGHRASALAVLERGWSVRVRCVQLSSTTWMRVAPLERERDEYFGVATHPDSP